MPHFRSESGASPLHNGSHSPSDCRFFVSLGNSRSAPYGAPTAVPHKPQKSPMFLAKHGGFYAKVVRFSLSVGRFRSTTRRPRNGRRQPHVRSAHDRRRDRRPCHDLRTSTAHTRRVHRESPAPPTPASDEGHAPRREANAGRRDGTSPPHSRPARRAAAAARCSRRSARARVSASGSCVSNTQPALAKKRASGCSAVGAR